jgi:ABC-type antimicrobial peptide transport system, ATPase component
MMIELTGITKSYGGAAILKEADLLIEKNEYAAIIGPSGSGKSTLMNLLGCLDMPEKGKYRLDGQAVYSLCANALSRLRGEKIGFVFQGFQLLMKLTALENAALPLLLEGVPTFERKARAALALEAVGLKNHLNHRPCQLSGGQQQRVAIARALIKRPPLILADEPTGNLDPHATAEILSLLENLHGQGHTIVMITHDEKVAAAAKRRIYVVDGRIY